MGHSKRLAKQRSKDTGPEMALRRLLFARGFRYRVHKRPLPSLNRLGDLVFARERLVVFVDGCFWHGCALHFTVPRSNSSFWVDKVSRNRERDVDTDSRLKAAGWTVVRVWEHEDPGEACQRVAEALLALRRQDHRTAQES